MREDVMGVVHVGHMYVFGPGLVSMSPANGVEWLGGNAPLRVRTHQAIPLHSIHVIQFLFNLIYVELNGIEWLGGNACIAK